MKLIEIDKPVCKLCLSNTVFTNVTMTAAAIKSLKIFFIQYVGVAINVPTLLYNWLQARKEIKKYRDI